MEIVSEVLHLKFPIPYSQFQNTSESLFLDGIPYPNFLCLLIWTPAWLLVSEIVKHFCVQRVINEMMHYLLLEKKPPNRPFY